MKTKSKANGPAARFGTWSCAFCDATNLMMETEFVSAPKEDRKFYGELGIVCRECGQTNYEEEQES
jgi:hypothetical protein